MFRTLLATIALACSMLAVVPARADEIALAAADASNPPSAAASVVADLAKLFAERHLINSSTAQAALQIAVWEIACETSGLNQLVSGPAELVASDQRASGDAAFGRPVLEPATYALLAGGLFVVGLVSRRRVAPRASN
jgi:hypothetical protein